MINGQNFFDQLVKNDLRTDDNIQKIAIGQAGDCTTGCLLDYNYFNNYYKMIAIDLSKKQADSTQQINFRRNLSRGRNANENTTMFFIIEEANGIILDFSQGIVRVL